MTTDAVAAYVIDTEFVWGFQARVAGLSKTSPSFTYPPPTTFLGALAESISRREALGESSFTRILNQLAADLMAVAVRPINCVPIKFQDINKIVAIKETGGKLYPDPANLKGSLDAPARGKTILVSLNDEAPKLRWVIAWAGPKEVNAGTKQTNVNEKHFWGIHRLGSKESVVTVTSVKQVEAEILPHNSLGQVTVTKYSIPVNLVDSAEVIEGEWVIETFANPHKPFRDGESPASRYVLGSDVIPYLLPVLTNPESSPVARFAASETAVILDLSKIGEGAVVGVKHR